MGARTSNRTVTVFGAYGHTGRFVVDELCRRGFVPILSGRDGAKLADMQRTQPALAVRRASIDDADALDRAIDGAAAVINCAGPFLDTAAPIIEAALRARIHYLDVTAEQQAVLDAFTRHADAARAAGITVMQGMAFYGGLADLLATAAVGDWAEADEIDIGVGLDGWHPTPGTRRTGERNRYPRLVVSEGRLAPLADPPSTREWCFPAPLGVQAMVALPLSETITISRHLRVRELHSYMSRAALDDIRAADTPPPVAHDASGRSAQRFAVDVVARRGTEERRARVGGRDIYAFTAPLVAEALERILDGRCRTIGVTAAGAAFEAQDMLDALAPALDP